MSLFVEEPFRATYDNGSEGEAPCLLLGIITAREAMICRADGTISVVPVDKVRLTWRYNPASDGWIDEAAFVDVTDQTEFGLGAQIGEDDGSTPDVPEPVRGIDKPPRGGRRS